tara:strand:+ start:213 stop:359 length:147 start_codon:yes stop_codon:yes gene_type:complete
VQSNKEELKRIADVLSGVFIIGKCTNTPFIIKKKEKKMDKKKPRPPKY